MYERVGLAGATDTIGVSETRSDRGVIAGSVLEGCSTSAAEGTDGLLLDAGDEEGGDGSGLTPFGEGTASSPTEPTLGVLRLCEKLGRRGDPLGFIGSLMNTPSASSMSVSAFVRTSGSRSPYDRWVLGGLRTGSSSFPLYSSWMVCLCRSAFLLSGVVLTGATMGTGTFRVLFVVDSLLLRVRGSPRASPCAATSSPDKGLADMGGPCEGGGPNGSSSIGELEACVEGITTADAAWRRLDVCAGADGCDGA